MRIIKKQISLLLIIISICSLSGCAGYKEIEQLGIAAGIAIDFDTTSAKYMLTMEMIVPGTSQNIGSLSSEFYTSNANTIFDAARLLIIKSGKRIFWSHSVVVLVSEEVSKTSIIPVLDWINRDSEPRSDMNLIITKGCTAKEVLMCKTEANVISSFHLNDIIKNQSILSKMTSATVWEFVKSISSGLTQPTAPSMQLDKTEEKTEQIIYGTTIFKTDKAVGYIDRDESFYLLMLKDKLTEGLIVIQNVLGTNTSISFEVFHNETTFTPIYDNENINMKIDVKTVVAIDEVSGTDDVVMDEAERNKLKKQTEKIVTKNLLNLIKKVQEEYNSDVFGFLSAIKINSPNAWRKLEPRKDEVFQNITSEINVQLIIKGSGTTSRPIKIGNTNENGR
jgi:spore germination protein KC